MRTSSALLAMAARHSTRRPATLGLDAPEELPLAEPEGEREQVWRTGWGYADRPVEPPVEQPATPEEAAA